MNTLGLWRYAANTFASNTRSSNVKMLSISTDTHAKLKAEEANPVIADILSVYEPVFFSYRNICQQYDLRVGDYRGTTLSFEQIMDSLPDELRVWEGAIRAVYTEDTPQERAIFPNKRTPFLQGTYEERINALGTLSARTTADPALAAVAAQITSLYNSALATRLAQQTDEGSLGEIADLREAQRLLLSNELMGVLGKLMFIHRANLPEIQRYFDLALLRNTSGEEPVIINGSIGPNTVININALAPDVEPGEEAVIRLRNTSDNPINLIFYAANSPGDFPGPGPQFSVVSGQIIEVPIADFNFEQYSNFNIYNPNPGNSGSWEVEIME